MRDLNRREWLLASGVALPAAWLVGCRSSESSVTREPTPALASTERAARLVLPSEPTTDGAGVRLRRALGNRSLSMLDPFLMLDEFNSDRPGDYIAGFPDHPHRGFETVTYMIHGAMEHRDSLGNHGRLGPGSVQWMTAGRGIIHSEMPKQEQGLMWGFQLWVNLPGRLKMTRPRYQDIEPTRVPEVTLGSATVRVVAGQAGGATGPVRDIVTQPQMFDVRLASGGSFRRELPASHSAFLYVFEGALEVGVPGRSVARGELAVLGEGDAVSTRSSGGARYLLLSGTPLREPVARRGPFVMNTQEELERAFQDYRSGRLTQG